MLVGAAQRQLGDSVAVQPSWGTGRAACKNIIWLA